MAGVPMIILPSVFDQPYNAMRVRYHKLGEAIFPEHCNTNTLEDALLHALSGEYDIKCTIHAQDSWLLRQFTLLMR